MPKMAEFGPSTQFYYWWLWVGSPSRSNPGMKIFAKQKKEKTWLQTHRNWPVMEAGKQGLKLLELWGFFFS